MIMSFKGLKQRRICNRCGRKTTLKKIFKSDGSIVIRCLFCSGEHVLKRPSILNKKGGIGYLFLFIFLIAFVVGAFLFFKNARVHQNDSHDDSSLNGTIYPLRFRSDADVNVSYSLYRTEISDDNVDDEKLTLKNITFLYKDSIVNQGNDFVLVFKYDRILFFHKSEGKFFDVLVLKKKELIDSGKLYPGIVESFGGNDFNTSYLLSVVGEKHYFEQFICRQDELEDVCLISPERIADAEMSFEGKTLFLGADNGLVRSALLCVAWRGAIVDVSLVGLKDLADIPVRYYKFVDKCYFLGDFRGRADYDLKIISQNSSGVAGTNLTFFLIDKARMSNGEVGYDEEAGMVDLRYELTL